MSLFAQEGLYFTNYNLQVGNLTREYKVYLPPGYQQAANWPAVFLFHGFNSSVTAQINVSEMYKEADTKFFYIIYPTGKQVYDLFNVVSGLGWYVPGNYIAEDGQDDVAFVNAIIDDMLTNDLFSVDPCGIHASGYSNGGKMAFHLACTLSDRIASVAGIAAQMPLLGINNCDPAQPVAVLHMQGTEDIILPVDGNDVFPSLEGTAEYWAAFNICNNMPVITPLPDIDPNDNSTVTLYNYVNCDIIFECSSDVLSYRIEGGGHTWPGGTNPWPFLGTLNMDINASTEIWNFFNIHSMPSDECPPCIVSINDLKNVTRLAVYPNPVSNKLTIEFELAYAMDVQLRLLNTLGQDVGSKSLGTLYSGHQNLEWQISTGKIPNGLYFLDLVLNGEHAVVKPIVFSLN